MTGPPSRNRAKSNRRVCVIADALAAVVVAWRRVEAAIRSGTIVGQSTR